MTHVDRIDGLELLSHLPAAAEPAALPAGRRTRFVCRNKKWEDFSWSESAPEVP
jgi:hypothetical protein